MKEFVIKIWTGSDVSLGTRIITAATSVRWIGWGFAESLIPIFLFMFAGNFARAGLIRSTYEIALILSLPIIGLLADRVRATTIILIGLSLYIIVGSGYLLAGLTGAVVWILVARLFNGFGYAMDSIGRETYFRRHNPSEHIATVFGYFDTITCFWWSLASLAGIVLVKYFAIHWLLFLIVPTVIASMIIVWKWLRPIDNAPVPQPGDQVDYRELLQEFGMWDWRLKLVVAFTFFTAFTSSIISFFLPIEMYREGSGFAPIILMGVILTIPAFFGLGLGEIFDKKGPRTFAYGLLLYAALLVGLAFSHSYIWQVAIALLIGFVQEFISVGKEELVTMYASAEHFGRVGGLMRSIVNIGAMVGPLAGGIIIDASNVSVVYLLLALLILVLAGGFVVVIRLTRKNS